MNNLELRIEGQLLELDSNVTIQVTKSFSDLTNPAAIKNNFSQQIKIPSTPNNDAIFTHIWRLDQVITTFNPSKRVGFTLSINGSLFEEGYIKLNTVDYSSLKDGLPDYYNVQLFGGLGDFFYQLSEMYMSDLYLFNDLMHQIDRNAVDNSFRNTASFPYNDYMKYVACYEGYYDNFESDRVYIGFDGEPKFIDLGGNRDQWQRRELRSYYQRPALKLGYLLSVAFVGTTYTVERDRDFFFTDNPYIFDTYLICPTYDTTNNNIRSGTYVTYKDMVRDGTTRLEFILSYLKPFGLIFKKNNVTRTIQIQTRETHFANYSIVDWTEKLDYSKTFSQTVIPFDYRYLKLKWKDAESYYSELYREKYWDREYAQLRVNTGYEFDDNEKDVLDGNIFVNSVDSFEVDSYFRRWQSGRLGSGCIAGKMLAMFNKSNRDRENNKDGYTIAFYEGIKNIDSDGNSSIGWYFITDDDPVLSTRDTYCWEYNENLIEPLDDNRNYHAPELSTTTRTTIPWFTRRTNTHSLDFAVPEESYDQREIYDPNSTIYNRYWKYFIEERLNVDNHILTAYFYLTNEEVMQWDFTKFVRIHDNLYFVNEIKSFEINGNTSTKCELVRVTDIDRYINLVDYAMSITPTSSQFRYVGGTGTVTITSNLPPTFSSNVSWITIDSCNWNGTNYTSIFTVEQNNNTFERSGILSYSNGRNTVTHIVNQLGYPYVTVMPVSQTTDPTAKTVTFTVTSNYPVNIS